ncbi:hypothetical protein JCM6882_002723 [Rhodosporidiobolus microsporus]
MDVECLAARHLLAPNGLSPSDPDECEMPQPSLEEDLFGDASLTAYADRALSFLLDPTASSSSQPSPRLDLSLLSAALPPFSSSNPTFSRPALALSPALCVREPAHRTFSLDDPPYLAEPVRCYAVPDPAVEELEEGLRTGKLVVVERCGLARARREAREKRAGTGEDWDEDDGKEGDDGEEWQAALQSRAQEVDMRRVHAGVAARL